VPDDLVDAFCGARVLMDRHPEWVEEVDIGGEAPADVDEPGDLERA